MQRGEVVFGDAKGNEPKHISAIQGLAFFASPFPFPSRLSELTLHFPAHQGDYLSGMVFTVDRLGIFLWLGRFTFIA